MLHRKPAFSATNLIRALSIGPGSSLLLAGSANSQDGETVYSGSFDDVQPEMMQLKLEFEDKLLQAVNTDPELNGQVIRLLALKSAVENYQSPRAQRRADSTSE
jgi:hypothetical protein